MAFAASGNLGTLFVKLAADSTGLVVGMTGAETTVTQSAAKMAKSLAVVGVAAAALATSAVKTFGDFDQAMTESTAIIGGVSRQMKDEMGNLARQMSTEGVQSATKLAKTYYDIGSAGLDAKQSMAALPIVARLASAGMFDAQKAAVNLIGSQNALGLSFKDPIKNMENMARLGDIMTKANMLAQGSVEDFSDALANKAAATMRTFNVEVESGVAVLAAMAKQNITGLKAGEEYAILLKQMAQASRVNEDEFKKLGIQVITNTGQYRDVTDILLDMEDAFKSMPPSVVNSKMALMGFQERSIDVINKLMGMSGTIRDLRKDLLDAGGSAKQVADENLTGFNAQMTILWHKVQEIALQFGQALAPTLLEINKILGDSITKNEGLATAIKDVAHFVGGALVLGLNVAKVAYQAFKDAITGLGLAMVVVAEVSLSAWNNLANGIAFVINGVLATVIGGVNLGIKALNTLKSLAPDSMGFKQGALIEAPKIDLENDTVRRWQEKFTQIRKDMVRDIITDNKAVSTEIAKVGDTVAQQTIKTFHTVTSEIDKALKDASDRAAVAAEKMEKILKDVGAPTGRDFLGRGKLDGLSKDQIAKLPEGQRDEFIPMSHAEKQLAIGGVGTGGDPLQQQFLQNQKELEMNKVRLIELNKIGDAELKGHEDVLKRKKQATELYMAQNKELQRQETSLILNTASNMFNDLSSVAKAWGGEQSAFYKTMFAMSKAFAIADATIKIMQGIAAAAANPWPANLAAMASVAAATASIVSNISSVALTFGGGKRMGGKVDSGVAYIVGEEGPELFTPGGKGGTITPNDKLMGGGMKTTVNVINQVGADVSVTESQEGNEKKINVLVARVKTEIASEIRDGRGNVNRAFQETFRNLKRGQT